MLKLGGFINILIAIAHMLGLFWATQMFEVTGIGKEMSELTQIHAFLPYLLTIFVSIVFLFFGLYGLSAGNNYIKLPFQKTVIFLIAGIYLLRGAGELVIDNLQGTDSKLETIYSTFALFVGFLFLAGGLKKWNLNRKNQKLH